MGKTEPQPTDTVAPPRNFTLSLEERLRGHTQGPPAYMLRRRRIEDLEARLVETIAAAEVPTVAAASADITAGLALLNDLIERHNRYYPIEANLPVDIRSGRIIDRGAPWRPLPAVSSADLVDRASRSVSSS
jgi:hypothetical protein